MSQLTTAQTLLKTWLTQQLHESTLTVVFTKKDGTKRTMRCTTSSELVPQHTQSESKKDRKINENTIAVYDLDATSWKSFRVASLKSISFEG